MASSRSASKSKRKCRKRNNTSIAKRNRCHNFARTKPVKDKHNIPVPEGENKSQERCNSNDILKKCFSEIHRKHEVLVAEHFQLKFHFQYFCNEFAKSIADGLNEVNRLCAAKHSSRSKMANSYKKSYAANMKVHVAAMNTDSQHPGSSLKGRGMRPCETKTIDEAECPSFDLGIDLQSNVPYIELDDGILRTQDDIMIIDDTVAGKISESHQTDDRVESSKKTKYTSPVVECSDVGCNISISKSSPELLDDDLVFTEEELRNMDESVEKHSDDA
ncbi:hypothetical protein Fot_19200 [Forsythia ovata]|uniref:Uncharacterized protein n=1 Tax=Forsythia ovata TaxID=205694 RepID=A0ABD1VKC2_9LAMI